MTPGVKGGIRRDLWVGHAFLFTAMSDDKIKVRDLRNGDWFWISKVLLDEYGSKIKPIGIAIYNCLAEHANIVCKVWKAWDELVKIVTDFMA